MPVTLRAINDPTYDAAFLPTLGKVLRGYPTPNTNLAAQSTSQTGDEQMFFNKASALAAPGLQFPAVLIASAPAQRRRAALSSYSGHSTYVVFYFDEWVSDTTRTFDAIWADVSLDLLRMVSNVESNDTMTLAGLNLTVALEPYTIAPYVGKELDTHTVPGRSLVSRTVTLPFVVLPYDV